MATRRIIIEVPEQLRFAAELDDAALGQELCTLAAVKLYELGRISSGLAAELAGMSRVELLSDGWGSNAARRYPNIESLEQRH